MKRAFSKALGLSFVILVVIIGALFTFRYYNLYRFHLEKQTRFLMDTYVTIYAVGPKGMTVGAIDLALDRMQEVDEKFSAHNPKGLVYAFNHRGEPIADPEIVGIAEMALRIARETDGAFDITIAPLVELWGFYGDKPHLPQDQDIKACLERIGYHYLSVTDQKLQKSRGDVEIDLGGIAKGYAVSEAAKILREKGVESAVIDAGGDVFALGKRGNKLWKVGIKDPRSGEDLLGYLEVEDLAVMGSGDYERFFEKDGKKYHHIFDPKTGYPAEGLSGTTLIHPDPVEADAWNTAIFVLGAEKGLEKVERDPQMEAIMVTTSGEVLYSSGLKNGVKPIPKNKN